MLLKLEDLLGILLNFRVPFGRSGQRVTLCMYNRSKPLLLHRVQLRRNAFVLIPAKGISTYSCQRKEKQNKNGGTRTSNIAAIEMWNMVLKLTFLAKSSELKAEV